MFLKAVTELPIDFEAVRAGMLDGPDRWLDPLADAAGHDQDRLLVDVGLGPGGGAPTRPASLSLGTPVVLGDRVLSLPLRLRMSDHAALFPVLDGNLDVAWLGEGRTYLAMAVQYEPPFGLLGRVADGALLHRVSELVVQRFLASAATRLTELCAAPDAATR
ncbi:MAG TPA: hypothetical protein VIC57_20105 [Candidatus Dormibacteraeota bacterium]|jgi:hypothetical protein